MVQAAEAEARLPEEPLERTQVTAEEMRSALTRLRIVAAEAAEAAEQEPGQAVTAARVVSYYKS